MPSKEPFQDYPSQKQKNQETQCTTPSASSMNGTRNTTSLILFPPTACSSAQVPALNHGHVKRSKEICINCQWPGKLSRPGNQLQLQNEMMPECRAQLPSRPLPAGVIARFERRPVTAPTLPRHSSLRHLPCRPST
jgi:hypothetical protein